MWTLIVITIFEAAAQPGGGHAVSVDHIPYMHTEEACHKAGNLLIEHQKEHRTDIVDIYFKCIKEKE